MNRAPTNTQHSPEADCITPALQHTQHAMRTVLTCGCGKTTMEPGQRIPERPYAAAAAQGQGARPGTGRG